MGPDILDLIESAVTHPDDGTANHALSQALDMPQSDDPAFVKDLIVRLRKRFRTAEECDPLTGCYNRLYLIRQWPGCLQRATQANQYLALALLDLDQFKTINDQQGHRAGDRLLEAWAHRLRRRAEPLSLCGRWGGDEFYVVFETTGAQDAGEHLTRLLRVTGSEEETACPVTATAGAWVFAPDAPDARVLETVLEQADQSLREAKRAGKAWIARMADGIRLSSNSISHNMTA